MEEGERILCVMVLLTVHGKWHVRRGQVMRPACEEVIGVLIVGNSNGWTPIRKMAAVHQEFTSPAWVIDTM